MNRILIATVAGALALSGAACTEPASSKPVVPVQGVKVSPQSAQLVVGERKQLTATVSPAGATNLHVAWVSSDTTVASVDATGVVTGKAAGFGVFVTAYTEDGNFQSSVNLTVNAATLAGRQ